jgi:hypothetical protein
MEWVLVKGVTYCVSSLFFGGQRVHNRRRPPYPRAKWIDSGALS